MRIIRFEDNRGKIHWGQQLDEKRAKVLSGHITEGFEPTSQTAEVARLLAPLVPVNIFAIGLNYRRHAAETKQEIPSQPVIFMKATTAVVGPGDPIRIPACNQRGPEVDYECELGVVIGKPALNVRPEEALDHVLGYTCANDVSSRRWQKHGGAGQWVRGKSFNTFCPLGPVLVTRDEIGDPQALKLSTTLNGTTMQSSNTSDMIFPVTELIRFVSQDTLLLPGTLILTGTPEGVGFARKPPVFLKPGDEVTVELQGIGRLTNPVENAEEPNA